MKLSHELCMVWIETAVFSNEQLVVKINFILESWRHGNFECFSVWRGDPIALVVVYSGPALIEEHICGVLFWYAVVGIVRQTSKGSVRNVCWIERSNIAVIKLNPGWCRVSCRTRPLTNIRVVMAMLAGTCVDKYTNKVERICFSWFAWVTKMIDMVRADVDRRRKFEVIVDLSPAEVGQIELEALQMEDEVVRHLLEAGTGFVSFARYQIQMQFTV
jgi:hypothetical protein